MVLENIIFGVEDGVLLNIFFGKVCKELVYLVKEYELNVDLDEVIENFLVGY